MKEIKLYSSYGINTYLNPLKKSDSELIFALNANSYPSLAKSKRPGYVSHLGTADGSAVSSLFSWRKNDGTTMFLYRASGSKVYYSTQGTGVWTVAGNGTISAGGHVGYAVLDNTMVLGDGVGSTRHTTDGTSFTNTTLAPPGQHFAEYQGRVYIGGTSSTLFYSSANDGTNWDTVSPNDSSSLEITGAGKISKLMKTSDRLVITKDSGQMFRWDGYSLVDMSTTLGPSSPYSVAKVEDYYFYANRTGIYGFGGGRPELLSNAIQNYIYNDDGTGIAGTAFDSMPSETYRYDYYASVGTCSDSFTDETINNAIIKYNFQNNEFLMYSFANKPTAWHAYRDINGVDQLLFGDANGQCYHFGGTALTDNGTAIESSVEYMITAGDPATDKEFKFIDMAFNPQSQAQVFASIGNTFAAGEKNWLPIGTPTQGILKFRFPQGSRGGVLYLRITDRSTATRYAFYGMSIKFEDVGY